jgi:Zn-dependent protease
MKSSYRVASIDGFDIKVHITLLILLLLPVMELASYDTLEEGLASASYSLSFLLILFASVLLHELAHSVVARRNKIRVNEITLWPLGGISSIGMIKDAKKELKVSLAGPLTSILLGFALLILLVSSVGLEGLVRLLESGDFLSPGGTVSMLLLAAYINIVLGFFNLFLPIFPMDGGRVLRALLELFMDSVKATKMAVLIGQAFLAVFFFFAILVGSLWLILIGIFLFIAGISELKLTELAARAEKADIEAVVKHGFLSISPDMEVDDFLKIKTPRQTLYPVVRKSGKPVGYLESDRLRSKKGRVGDIMSKDFPEIRLGGNRERIITEVFGKGYAFVVDNKGRLTGVLTVGGLREALKA